MQAHALVLVLVAALVAPAPPLHGTEIADPAWDQAQQLTRRGDYTDAEQLYASMADQLGPQAAPRALLLEARAQLEDADTSGAEATLGQLLNAYPRSDQAAGAWFTL